MKKDLWIDILERSIYGNYKYGRGKLIYERGMIHDIRFNEDNDGFHVVAFVEGSYNNKYTTALFVNSNQRVIESHCSCPDKWNNSDTYLCKHTIALVLSTIDFLNNEYRNSDVLKPKDIEKLVKIYKSSSSDSLISKPLEFEFELKFLFTNIGVEINLGIKVGSQKLYVVKKIPEFLQVYKGFSNECQLTKEIIYKKEKYGIKEEEGKLFDLLFDIISYNNLKGYQISKNRFINIPIAGLKELNQKLKSLNVKYNLGGYEIIEGNPDLKLILKEKDQGLCLEFNDKEKLEGYSEKTGFIIFDKKCYLTDEKYWQKMGPIFNLISDTGGSVYIEPENKKTVIQSLLPYLVYGPENVIEIEKKLASDIEIRDLNVKLYIDKEGKRAVLTLVFDYGEKSTKEYALKNITKEQEIINDLNCVKLITDKDKYYIESLEEIFKFTEEIIPLLQEKEVKIFYSEAFKTMLKKRNFSYQSSISFESDLLSVNFNYDDIDKSELRNILLNIKEAKKYYQLKNGNVIKIDNDEAREWKGLIEKLDINDKDLNSDKYLFSKYEALYLDNVFEEIDDEKIKYEEEFKYLIDNIKNSDQLNFEIPSNLNAKLRDYQTKGYRWLKTLKYFGFGGILADDMGLGKTLQAITLIQDLQNDKQDCKVLVVAPSSVIYNWEAELIKFAPSLKYIVLGESKLIREKHFENLDDYNVIITSYALIRRDINKYEEYNFDYCFLDEAQYIKNFFSSSANACKRIKAETKYAMTGTPIENSLSELWSIFDFIMPGYLRNYNYFKNNYEKKIMQTNDEETLDKLYSKVKPFILRREKKNVALELPLKQERNVYISLEGEQEKIYMAYLLKAKKEIKKEIATSGFNKSHIKILSILTKLRQICCHPDLFVENYQGSSAKLDHLLELIEDRISKGHRILLFSQFTSMLDIIQDKLDKDSYFRIDGKVKSKDRMEMVNKFNMGEKEIFLISLKAGGTGLNLVGADTVIHFDPWWNPAVEDQATDRAYRIGQENRVEVYKLITKNTIEEKINELKDKKREMANAIIKSGETFINKLNEEELANIFAE